MDSAYHRARKTAHSPCATLFTILFMAFNVAMLVVGYMERNECPIKTVIPLFLMVAGGVGIFSKLLLLLNRQWDYCLLGLVGSIIYLFEFVWIIVGSYWVYGIFKPNFDKNKGPYCSEHAYIVSFWLLTVYWILMVLSIVFGCCCCCCPNCFKTLREKLYF